MTKSASSAMITFLNAAIGSSDVTFYRANAYQFTLANGTNLYYTDVDVNFVFNSQTYLGNSILISGLKYKATIGLDVDQQEITIKAASTNTVSGVQFLQALQQGAFDGCTIKRTLVFWTDKIGGTLVDNQGVIMFQGRLGDVSDIGRTSATLTVNSDLVLLDMDMPRNLYQATCLHTLYDAGCTLSKGSFSGSGTVLAGSTKTVINAAVAALVYQQGVLKFTSGVNNGISSTVKSAIATTSLTLVYPLITAPNAGDTFTVYQGCDHTPGTCFAQFNNFANFRGFPLVPPTHTAF